MRTHINDFRFEKWEDMQNISGSTSSSRTSRAVHGWSYNRRKLNNVLGMQCCNHTPLLRKDCSCGLSINDSSKGQTLPTHKKTLISSAANFSSTEKLICLLVSLPGQIADRLKNALEYIGYLFHVSTSSHVIPSQIM